MEVKSTKAKCEPYAEYAFDFIKEICEKFGSRYSSSEAEKNVNFWIKKELSNFCDETFIEEFDTNPNLYPQGIFKICGVLGSISSIFFPFIFPFSILPAVLILLVFFVLISELMFMKRWIRFFFKKGKSSNVFGIIRPTSEIKYRIIFEGHTDSAKMMRGVNENSNPSIALLLFGVSFLIYTLILSIIKFSFQIILRDTIIVYGYEIFQWTVIDYIYFIPWLVLFPSFLYLIYEITGNIVVEGANDNLSGIAISAALAKFFSNNRPENIEIIVASMGSEEIGDRGAKYFVENHGDLLKDSYTFVIESAGAGDEIFIIEKDFMHLSKYTIEVIQLIEDACKLYKEQNLRALPYRKGKIPLGSSDACMYIKAGYKASFIIVVENGLKKPPHWHSITDTWNNINRKVLENVIGIAINFVNLVDKKFESVN